jgi:hypothetical protein
VGTLRPILRRPHPDQPLTKSYSSSHVIEICGSPHLQTSLTELLSFNVMILHAAPIHWGSLAQVAPYTFEKYQLV